MEEKGAQMVDAKMKEEQYLKGGETWFGINWVKPEGRGEGFGKKQRESKTNLHPEIFIGGDSADKGRWERPLKTGSKGELRGKKHGAGLGHEKLASVLQKNKPWGRGRNGGCCLNLGYPLGERHQKRGGHKTGFLRSRWGWLFGQVEKKRLYGTQHGGKWGGKDLS